VLQLQRDLEEANREIGWLQQQLAKARESRKAPADDGKAELQRQLEEARAERDRERLRAESLQKSSQQLLRQLKRESARAHMLERQLTGGAPAEAKGNSPLRPGSARGDPGRERTGSIGSPRGGHDEVQAESPQGADGGRGGDGVPPEEVRATTHAEQAAADELEAARQEVAGGHGRPEGVQSASFDHRIDGGGMEQRSWEFVVQGQHDPGRQQDFAPKIISCYPDEAVERAATRGCVTVCMRGRRLDKSVPNQDDFVAARHTLVHDGHIALYAVFDGHGPAGHHCAAFARGLLPESLFGQRTLLLKPEETLREAFRQTQAGLLKQPFDTEHSGTTVALALVLNLPSAQHDAEKAPHGGESWLFVAHVGDSRAILASHRQGDPTAFTVTALTRDHRPDNEDEAERVQQAGGEIRKLRENSGAVRVFARGQDRPALALTRTLGAAAAADCGVSSEPEVSAYRLRPGVDALLVLGTDGLFEFCNNTDAAASLLKEGVTGAALQELCASSQRQWAKTSYNETVDDITAIAAMLPDGKP